MVGSEYEYLMNYQMPKDFYGANHLKRLMISIFSKSENIRAPNSASFKYPFTVSRRELRSFVGADTRVGGFGPLFGGAIILGLVIILLALLLDLKKAVIAVGILFWIMISVLACPQA